jgi:hypothetical protein
MQSTKLALYLSMLLGCLHFYGCGAASEEAEAASQECPACAACPYSFAKPKCEDAEPQAPRDLSTGAEDGKMKPKAVVLDLAQAKELPLTNVHFHLGAEHKSDAYTDGVDSEAYDAAHGRRLGSDPRPGWMCPKADLTAEQTAEYKFEYCKGDVAVGKTYEVHYVHSSAGYDAEALKSASVDLLSDGLGGAANGRGLLNPMVVVQGQVYQIVNNGAEYEDMLHEWVSGQAEDYTNAVMYMGSTTGQGHDNEVCSPYAITWHVDKACVQVSPQSFDKMCKMMKDEYNMEADLYPHGSRKILDAEFVVPLTHVQPLA